MKREIEVIRYLLDEIEAQDAYIQKRKAEGTFRFEILNYQLIKDNAKKIRKLALKIGKEAKE